MRGCLPIVLIILAGCSQPAATTDLPPLQEGDYWIYETVHGGEVQNRQAAVVGAATTLGGHDVFPIQVFLEDVEGIPSAATVWVTADEARVASAQAYDVEGDFSSARTYVSFDEPCPTRPSLGLAGPQHNHCSGLFHYVNNDGRPFDLGFFSQASVLEVQGPDRVEAAGTDVAAVMVLEPSTRVIEGREQEVEGHVWLSAETCGFARREAEGLTTRLAGYRCGGIQRGLSLQDVDLVRVPVLEADMETLRPSVVEHTCEVRQTAVRIGPVGQTVFESGCDLAESRLVRPGVVIGQMRVNAEWDASQSAIVAATLTVGDESVSGPTSPLELVVNDVDGDFSELDVRLDYEGASNYPSARIKFVMSQFT